MSFFYEFFMSNPSGIWYDIFTLGFLLLISIVVFSLFLFYFVLNKRSSRFNGIWFYLGYGLTFLIIQLILEFSLAASIGEFVELDSEMFKFLFANSFYFILFYFLGSWFVKRFSVNGSNVPF